MVSAATSRKSNLIGVAMVTLLLASSGIGLAQASWLFPSMHMHFPAAPAANLLAQAHRQLFNSHNRQFDNLWNEMLEQQLTALQCQKHCNARVQRTLAHELVVDEQHNHDGNGEFVATIALPHVKPEDVSVEISGDHVLISASRSPVPAPASPLDKSCQCVAEQHQASRRVCGAAAPATGKEEWSRRYQLPRHTPLDAVRAVLDQSREQIYEGEDRVPVATLTLTVPKPQPPASKKLMVTVNPMVETDEQEVPALAAPLTDSTSTSSTTGSSSSAEATPAAAAPAPPASSSSTGAASPSQPTATGTTATTNASDADVINLD